MHIIKRKIVVITVACTIFGCSQPNHKDNKLEDSAQHQLTEPKDAVDPLELKLKQAGLVDIQTEDSLYIVDLKYSSTDNFLGVDVYGALKHCYLQPTVAKMLSAAQLELSNRKPGYRLLCYDCARPLSVQQILWDTLQKPEEIKHLYVADPQQGSIHNYGAAVDLTIADRTGVALDMGTGYDHFGELAYPAKEGELLERGALTLGQLQNRKLLREVMISAGFTPISTEWWHFNAYSRKKAAELFEMIQ